MRHVRSWPGARTTDDTSGRRCASLHGSVVPTILVSGVVSVSVATLSMSHQQLDDRRGEAPSINRMGNKCDGSDTKGRNDTLVSNKDNRVFQCHI
jgi:hypothetical protein